MSQNEGHTRHSILFYSDVAMRMEGMKGREMERRRRRRRKGGQAMFYRAIETPNALKMHSRETD